MGLEYSVIKGLHCKYRFIMWMRKVWILIKPHWVLCGLFTLYKLLIIDQSWDEILLLIWIHCVYESQLIWVQTVYNGYQQTTKVTATKKRVNKSIWLPEIIWAAAFDFQ